MAKLTYDDKMRIQTLREQCMGAEAIKSAYPMKNLSTDTLKTMCQLESDMGTATAVKPRFYRGFTAVMVFILLKRTVIPR